MVCHNQSCYFLKLSGPGRSFSAFCVRFFIPSRKNPESAPPVLLSKYATAHIPTVPMAPEIIYPPNPRVFASLVLEKVDIYKEKK